MKFFLTLIILFFTLSLTGCSSMKSGRYVDVKPGETIESLAKIFKVPAWKIKSHNPESDFSEGSWIFIPLRRGIAGYSSYYKLPDVTIEPEKILSSADLMWPVPSSKRVSSKFGKRWGKMHEGIDIAARGGSKIVAAERGVVVHVGTGLGGYGKTTVLAHPDGLFSVYAHARKTFTHKGQQVSRGQVIAEVGSSGKSTGNHLHFELRFNSRPLNPGDYLADIH